MSRAARRAASRVAPLLFILVSTTGCGGRAALPPPPLSAAPPIPPPPAMPEQDPPARCPEPRPDRARWSIELLPGGLSVVRIPRSRGEGVAHLIGPRAAPLDVTEEHVVTVALRWAEEQLVPDFGFRQRFDTQWIEAQILAPPQRLGAAVQMLVSALSAADITESEFEHIHQRLLQSVAESNRGYGFGTEVALHRGRYGNEHPWSRDVPTWLEALAALDFARFRALIRSRFPRDRSVLLLVGPPQHFPTASRLAERFDWLPETAPTRSAVELPRWTRLGVHRIHLFPIALEQTMVRTLHVGPGQDAGRPFYAFRVLAQMMNGFGSDANQTFRHAKGASYGLGASIDVKGVVTEIQFGGMVEHRYAPDVVLRHAQWLRKLASGRADPSSIQRAKAQVLFGELRTVSNPPSLAAAIARRAARARARCADDEACLAGVRLDASLPPELCAVTADDVVQVVQKHLDPNQMEVSVAGSDPETIRRFHQLGEVITYQIGRKPSASAAPVTEPSGRARANR